MLSLSRVGGYIFFCVLIVEVTDYFRFGEEEFMYWRREGMDKMPFVWS